MLSTVINAIIPTPLVIFNMVLVIKPVANIFEFDFGAKHCREGGGIG